MSLSLTLLIVIVTVVISFLGFNNRDIIARLIFSPHHMERSREYYRFLSHGLIHADFIHLLFNMYVLYLFGGMVESIYSTIEGATAGRILFFVLYLSALVASSMKTFFEYRESPTYSALGASGAVSAIVFSAIALYPQMSLSLFFIPVPILGWIFAILYLLYSAYMARKNYDNIGHDAHFWGAVYGIVFTAAFFFPNVINAWRALLGV
jgi:membrane associated rhomboid family serine protease